MLAEHCCRLVTGDWRGLWEGERWWEVRWRWSGHILDTFDSAGALCMGSHPRKRSPDCVVSTNGRFPDARFTSSKKYGR